MIDFSALYGSREFSVERDDFSQLEIRSSGKESLHYFYDNKNRRLVTDFVLHEGARVATVCTVTLIYKDGSYTPRLKFWKKDKTKPGNQPYLDIEIPDTPDTRTVKAFVDTSEAHQNFWVLIKFLQECRELSLPTGQFKIVGNDRAEIAKMLQDSDKGQVVEALKSVLGSSLTQAELDVIANRKGQLEVFFRYLTDRDFFDQRREQLKENDKDSGPEAVWQEFFEKNPWIFGYGLSLIACRSYDDEKLQQVTAGANKFGGAGKRTDGLLRTRGVVSSLLFCEIKRHDTPLLASIQYRKPDVYAPSHEVVGAASQVQKTAEKAVRGIRDFIHHQYDPDGTPTGLEVSTVKPRQVVVVGHTGEFESAGRLNREKVSSFELYRRSVSDVEVITFDELYERACFIIQDKE
ncbi:Shedu immune nuclease family protein [Streptosporangium sp. NPDC020145]|uniref:Shedu immune nuclease family protein n=1 Tax=Streptosporangium sp. NPDC020145 TaxID=3154694 RepID=UPI00342CC8B4